MVASLLLLPDVGLSSEPTRRAAVVYIWYVVCIFFAKDSMCNTAEGLVAQQASKRPFSPSWACTDKSMNPGRTGGSRRKRKPSRPGAERRATVEYSQISNARNCGPISKTAAAAACSIFIYSYWSRIMDGYINTVVIQNMYRQRFLHFRLYLFFRNLAYTYIHRSYARCCSCCAHGIRTYVVDMYSRAAQSIWH